MLIRNLKNSTVVYIALSQKYFFFIFHPPQIASDLSEISIFCEKRLNGVVINAIEEKEPKLHVWLIKMDAK